MDFMARVGRGIDSSTKSVDYVARGAIMAVMVLTCVNIITRLFGQPILGAQEISGALMAMTLAFALPYSVAKKIHVDLELLVSRLPARVQAVMDVFVAILNLCLFLLITWQCWKYASKLANVHALYATLRMPIYPFVYMVFFGFALSCLVLLFDVVKSVVEVKKR
jgi:TRAP-type C4-dicarboxylate transport system permease small subunit